MGYRLAVFDFDGTLVDTSGPIVAAAQAALRAAGHLEPEAKAVRRLVGLPLDVVMGSLAGGDRPAHEVADLCARYRGQFADFVPGRTRLFEGVRETISRLSNRGLPLAVATSRSRTSLEAILEAHGLRRAFAMLITDGCVEHGKPHPEMLHRLMERLGAARDETVMIGDTVHDLRMGHAAGVDTCAVTYGFHAAEELRAERPTYVVDHAREIPALLA